MEITEAKLNYLMDTKEAIKQALISKGQTVEDSDTFRSYADKITDISGGGSVEGFATVTFMNGNEEDYSRPVYIGDDCPNPVTQGRIEVPIKESTVDTVYTYNGWSSADGGTADESALKNITEDKTLYAAFEQSVRYYTINFYDGEKLVNTEQLPYGGSSDYTYLKDELMFNGWTPEPTNITADMDCFGEWIDKPNFATSSWETIANISESGQAAEIFNVGDERDITVTYADGTTEVVTLQIAGFNEILTEFEYFDASKDKTAGITIIAKNVLSEARIMGSSISHQQYGFQYGHRGKCELYNWLQNDFYNALPTDFVQILKPQMLSISATSTDEGVIYTSHFANVMLPSHYNIFGTYWQKSTGIDAEEYRTNQLSIFKTENNRIRYDINGIACSYWTATTDDSRYKQVYVFPDGKNKNSANFTSTMYVLPMFSI